jgi:hypothetical protein
MMPPFLFVLPSFKTNSEMKEIVKQKKSGGKSLPSSSVAADLCDNRRVDEPRQRSHRTSHPNNNHLPATRRSSTGQQSPLFFF